MGVRKFIKRESPGEYEGYSERFVGTDAGRGFDP